MYDAAEPAHEAFCRLQENAAVPLKTGRERGYHALACSNEAFDAVLSKALVDLRHCVQHPGGDVLLRFQRHCAPYQLADGDGNGFPVLVIYGVIKRRSHADYAVLGLGVDLAPHIGDFLHRFRGKLVKALRGGVHGRLCSCLRSLGCRLAQAFLRIFQLLLGGFNVGVCGVDGQLLGRVFHLLRRILDSVCKALYNVGADGGKFCRGRMNAQHILDLVQDAGGHIPYGIQQALQTAGDAASYAFNDVFAKANPVEIRKLFLGRIANQLEQVWNGVFQRFDAQLETFHHTFSKCAPAPVADNITEILCQIESGLPDIGHHAHDPVFNAGDNGIAEIQPVECCDGVHNGRDDPGQVLHQHGNAIDQTFCQLSDQRRGRTQQLRRVVVDDARDVGHDQRHVGDQYGQAVDETVRQALDQRETGIHQLPRIFPQAAGKGNKHSQCLFKKLRDCLLHAIGQAADQ